MYGDTVEEGYLNVFAVLSIVIKDSVVKKDTSWLDTVTIDFFLFGVRFYK